MTAYEIEKLDEDSDDGTMVESRDALAAAVVGHRIVSVERESGETVITLDDGTRVALVENSDCCAYTEVTSFLLHADRVDHIITGVGTTGEFQTWHIYADMGDVLALTVGWSCGNPFYYAYGLSVVVRPAAS